MEAEARVPLERPLVSAVYHNRLVKGMRLEADPTVAYAMGGRPGDCLADGGQLGSVLVDDSKAGRRSNLDRAGGSSVSQQHAHERLVGSRRGHVGLPSGLVGAARVEGDQYANCEKVDSETASPVSHRSNRPATGRCRRVGS